LTNNTAATYANVLKSSVSPWFIREERKITTGVTGYRAQVSVKTLEPEPCNPYPAMYAAIKNQVKNMLK
jgi:hypothetical protein